MTIRLIYKCLYFLGWQKWTLKLGNIARCFTVTERPMDEKIRSKLQDRFVKRSSEETVQMGLVNFMNATIDDFASENPSRVPAIKITQTMIAIVIRLFSNLYGSVSKAD